ncbi:MAG TPA: alpha-1,4-glucan--maltose-1-phosphate maltosyltransferase [Planctomycetota bacterium]|nr:alpha-1,4-glucan--maltose-1-phosphate maltosyltransferase [Planctomycetota bacterium]
MVARVKSRRSTANRGAPSPSIELPAEALLGQRRVIIEGVRPCVDGGAFPAKRTLGDEMAVTADVFADGHDCLRARVQWRLDGVLEWDEGPMVALGNDRWQGMVPLLELGRYRFRVVAWIDPFRTWRRDMEKKIAAGVAEPIDFAVGAAMVRAALSRADGDRAPILKRAVAGLEAQGPSVGRRTVLDDELAAVMAGLDERLFASTSEPELEVVVDPVRARFSSWYECFPRSCAAAAGRHGTFADLEARLPYIAGMGFDVLYLPPIHPIGRKHRKGPNNSPTSAPGDHGSPWAIGAAEGGHTAVHPELGDLDAFRSLVAAARAKGIELALDIALQVAPDHPWVAEHPEWFRQRPDGTVQYAENPPKKYQDIYPFDFECAAWRELWAELRAVFEFWVAEGVTIFRVDNPHTKCFAFWQWCIGALKQQHPELIFLSEAFTRPKLMYRLAKLGFTQSYTYFPWRNHKTEIVEYFTEISRLELREFFRPNHWPNTPDILTAFLQTGGVRAFEIRLVLAATLGASYGVYGPAFELAEGRAVREGSEEYLDSEKYQLRHWDLDAKDSLRRLIARVNRIRRENPALQSDLGLRFHDTTADELICYSKSAADGNTAVLVVVNLDPHHRQSGHVELQLDAIGIDHEEQFQVHDLLSGARYLWRGARNYVELDPESTTAHVFVVRRRLRSEQDFDYFL